MLKEIQAVLPIELGSIDNYRFDDIQGKVSFTLVLSKPMDAMGRSVVKAIESLIASKGYTHSIVVQQPTPKSKSEVAAQQSERLAEQGGGVGRVRRIIAIASGKGGVGKSSVAAALARQLASRGERVGVLDADIYGPSQPRLLGVEGYVPIASEHNKDLILPAISDDGIKVMSVAFFIAPSEALVWRGPMATSALKQFITHTVWGELDTLVVDLPPGTGDVHLTVAAELKIDKAIVVTTPSDLAIDDVVRGVKMLSSKGIEIPIAGVINNMAYFQTDDVPGKKYYIFGSADRLEATCRQHSLPLLGSIALTENRTVDAVDLSEIVDKL